MDNRELKLEIQKYIEELKAEYHRNFDNITKIKTLMKQNNGYITNKEIDNNKIARIYLKKMLAKKEIIKVARGVYISNNIIEDPFYTFQLRYPYTVFSHFTALSFYNIIDSIPNTYDVTCINNVYANDFKKFNVFYVKKEWYDIGLTEITDNYGFKIKAYDLERSICDIIRSQKRLDVVQVKKAVRAYAQMKNKNIANLSLYSKQMGINKEVMNFINMYLE